MMGILFVLQELELLPAKELHQNVYIKHPVSIEQYLMEGSYNKVCGWLGSSVLWKRFLWLATLIKRKLLSVSSTGFLVTWQCASRKLQLLHWHPSQYNQVCMWWLCEALVIELSMSCVTFILNFKGSPVPVSLNDFSKVSPCWDILP